MDFLKKGIYVYNRILISNKEEQTTDIYYNIDKSQNIMQNEKSFIRIMNDYLCEILKQIELIYTGELQGSAYPGRPFWEDGNDGSVQVTKVCACVNT